MSAENFQLLDYEKMDNSDIRREFVKKYHQHGAKVNDENQEIQFFLAEIFDYIQVSNGHLEFEMEIRKADKTFFIKADDNTKEVFTFVNNAFTFTNHDARISTSAGTEIEQNKLLGPLSRILTLITQKKRMTTYSDKIDENEDGINSSSVKQRVINKHTETNRGITKKHLPRDYVFGFCRSFKK